MEQAAAQLKAENQRWELEFSKQQKRIDKLLDPASGNKIGQNAAETRRDIEKTLIVRQLKQQIQSLRSIILERDAELEAQKRTQKQSKILELTAEKEEYFAENMRLKKLLKEIKEELQAERQRREWSKHVSGIGNGLTGDIRKEMVRLSTGYQNILAGMTEAAADAQAKSPQNRSAAAGAKPFASTPTHTRHSLHPVRPCTFSVRSLYTL